MDYTKELLAFIKNSPSTYHVIHNMKNQLLENNYKELSEGDHWDIKKGGKYFVTRNQSSLIAFNIPAGSAEGFHIIASHSDSPCFKLKEYPELKTSEPYTRLNVEAYGGMLISPWLDRPLSVAGRIVVQEQEGISSRLVHIDRDLVLIPNQSIHMNREANNGSPYKPHIDLLPLFGDNSADGRFAALIAETAGVAEQDILGSDLFLYNRMPGTIWGAHMEYLSSPRLDDLQCAFSSMKGFLEADAAFAIPVHCVLDNEEVGSNTKQGAASTFLKDTLQRIVLSLNASKEAYYTMLANSFLLSADNAHSVHPNAPEKADATNRPYMNKGIVIKHNANQKYTTDAISAAIFKSILNKAGIPFQTFFNRSDMAGGSTLGNISSTQIPINSADIGLAQLAMHSPYETAGVKDTGYLIQAVRAFLSSSIQYKGDGNYSVTLF